jgi:LPXTG-motif cell wall-anchored protein
MASFTSSMIEDFFKQIGDFASGKFVVTAVVPQKVEPPSTGRVAVGWLILIGVLALIGAVFWYISKQ